MLRIKYLRPIQIGRGSFSHVPFFLFLAFFDKDCCGRWKDAEMELNCPQVSSKGTQLPHPVFYCVMFRQRFHQRQPFPLFDDTEAEDALLLARTATFYSRAFREIISLLLLSSATVTFVTPVLQGSSQQYELWK